MQTNDSFIKQVFHLATGSIVNLIIGVLTTPIITRLVDPVEYGQLNLFNTYSSIALMVFTIGLDQTFVRYYYVEKEKPYQKKLLDFCLGLPIVIAVLGSVAIFLLNAVKPELLGFDSIIIWCFIANIFILIMNRYGMLVLRLQYKTVMYSAMNILQKVLFVGIVISFVFLLKRNYFYILVIATLISVLITTFVSIVSEKHFWFERIRKFELPISKKELLKFGLPLMVSSGIFILFQATDRLCIKHFGTYSDVGVYSSAQSLMSVFAVIQITFNTLWAPKAIEHYEKNPNDKSYYVRMNQIITVVMFLFGAFVLVGKDLFVLLLGEKYREASSIIPYLMFNPMMYTISETTVTGLAITKHTTSQVIITGLSAAANLIGNIILIPVLGSKGAAVSTGLSYILFFTLRTLFSNHFFPIDFKIKKFYLMTVVFALGSWYHMYHSFDSIVVAIFFVTVGLICILYKDTIKDIIEICKVQFAKNKNKTL